MEQIFNIVCLLSKSKSLWLLWRTQSNRLKITDFFLMYRPSLSEPKTNLSEGSEQVECLCGSAVQFDFGSNRLSAVFFFECPRLKGLVGSVGYCKGFPQRKLKISYRL